MQLSGKGFKNKVAKYFLLIFKIIASNIICNVTMVTFLWNKFTIIPYPDTIINWQLKCLEILTVKSVQQSKYFFL